MAIYTIHVPNGEMLPEAADQVRFVPEQFAWRALVFGPLWLLWNRLWVEGSAALALIVAWYGIVRWQSWPESAFGLGVLLLNVLLGLEGRTLLRAALTRRNYTLTGVVMGDTLTAAELHFFSRWTPGAPQPQQSPDVIGLFPQAEGRR
ncbi:DUF2628 domain-containing protein [Methylovirgula sp. 4M-Z18]|uniref:DUF2628 domain-containing protein n=1 Tax=Methylovirgula sp. 4M-Z18 TaxID=2293567 RepID=UPI000E2F5088|nr:DUF2628 domain-containing protein [Methylovirgula sp. 4M-Z18]RFB78063.1 DUF2628 domain-containing protein [Methylovirgula sp. 4M-Z18]